MKGYGSLSCSPYVYQQSDAINNISLTKAEEDEESLEPLIRNQAIFKASDDIPFMSNPMRKTSNKLLVSHINNVDQRSIQQQELYEDNQINVSFVSNPMKESGLTVDSVSLMKLDEEIKTIVRNKHLTKFPKTQVIVSPEIEDEMKTIESRLVDDVYRQSDLTIYLGKSRIRLYGLLVIVFMITVMMLYSTR